MASDVLSDLKRALERRYVLGEELGTGKTARVFAATGPAGERLALKVLIPELHASIEGQRFIREMELLQKLDHPLLARVVAAGIAGGHIYYLMPRLEGPTLRHRLLDGPLPIDAVLALADDLLDALGHAHDHGVVHRDVAPDNILLTPDGATLVDLGLGRALERAGRDRVTLPGVAVGSAPYMSPEQCLGLDCDGRSDLYSVACVLFECLAGQPPFTHVNPLTVQQMQLKAAPPAVTSFRPDTPPALAGAIAHALGKKPEQRFPDASVMKESLR